ncbi:hypothetical protein HYZ76_02270 [Candidatus Falkowbacteria bacterium]|nr:hypothetical protein [Candidatus Falkowbacteria bacterium]
MKEALGVVYDSIQFGLSSKVTIPIQAIEEYHYLNADRKVAEQLLREDPGMQGILEYADAHTKIVPYEIEDADGNYTLFNIVTDNTLRISPKRARELFADYMSLDQLDDSLHMGDSIDEDKGYTEADLDDAIAAYELREQFITAVDDLANRLGEDKESLYHLEALCVIGRIDTYDIGSLQDAFLELTDLNQKYNAEQRASKISYREVLERADKLQLLIDSGLVGTGLQAKMQYGKKIKSIYKGIDEAMDGGDGQKKLAKQVLELDTLEAKLNQSAASRIAAVARKVEAAYARAIATDVSADIREELFDGAKFLAESAVDIKYDGLNDRNVEMYMGKITSIEALADKTLTVNGRNTYIPLPIKADQLQL